MSSLSRLLDFLGNQSRQDKSFGGSPRRLLSYSAVWSGTLSSLAVRRISYWVGSRRRRHTLSAGCAHLSKLYWSIHWVSPKVSHLFFQEWSWWHLGGKWTSCMTQYSPVLSNQSGPSLRPTSTSDWRCCVWLVVRRRRPGMQQLISDRLHSWRWWRHRLRIWRRRLCWWLLGTMDC